LVTFVVSFFHYLKALVIMHHFLIKLLFLSALIDNLVVIRSSRLL
jgi:hypothetical protein